MLQTHLVGRLGQDCEIRDTDRGNTVINFSVAHSKSWKDKDGNKHDKTVWVECSWWLNNTTIAKYLKKGITVAISGEPSSRAYVNKQGEAIGILCLNVRQLELLGGKSESEPSKKPEPIQREKYENGNDDEGDNLPF